MELQVIEIPNIHAFQGMIPAGKNLTVYEKGTDPLDGFKLTPGGNSVCLLFGENLYL